MKKVFCCWPVLLCMYIILEVLIIALQEYMLVVISHDCLASITTKYISLSFYKSMYRLYSFNIFSKMTSMYILSPLEFSTVPNTKTQRVWFGTLQFQNLSELTHCFKFQIEHFFQLELFYLTLYSLTYNKTIVLSLVFFSEKF